MAPSRFGFSAFFEQAFASLSFGPDVVPARVIRGGSSEALVAVDDDHHEGASPRLALVRGETPVVGDWIAFDRARGLSLARLPRRTCFARKSAGRTSQRQIIAANADVAFLVMALVGDDSTRRLERYLALVATSGATAVVVLTKAALAANPERRAEEIARLVRDHRVLLLDLPTGRGGDELCACLPAGTTAVLLGSSGAGKSTIVNYLAERDLARTGDVRAGDDRGKHTTTHRELFVLPSGGMLIDTPGMREIGLVGSEADVDEVFDDVTTLAGACRFRDCRHAGEPGCAVRAAADAGDLDEDRLESFQRLHHEAAREALRRDEHARRQAGRAGAQQLKQALRRKGRI